MHKEWMKEAKSAPKREGLKRRKYGVDMLQRFSLTDKTGIGRSNSEERGVFHGY